MNIISAFIKKIPFAIILAVLVKLSYWILDFAIKYLNIEIANGLRKYLLLAIGLFWLFLFYYILLVIEKKKAEKL